MPRERKITVVGSYATGLTIRVDRLPARGETVLGSGYRVDYGGKGSNQAVGCARLGANVHFIARIGQDAFGDMALKLYRDEGVGMRGVKRAASRPTGVGFILVESGSGNNSIALDPGANELLSAEDVGRADEAFASAHVVLTQLEIPVEAAREALARGRAHDATTILNPAPVRPLSAKILKTVDVLTPNESEAKVLAGYAPDAAIPTERVARQLISLGVKQVAMTLGEEGVLVVTPNNSSRVPAISVPAVDTTGAGDAFNAALAVALVSGATLEEAVQWAVVAGGLAVTKEGVIPALPYRQDILAFLEKNGQALPAWAQPSGRGKSSRRSRTEARASRKASRESGAV